MIYFSVKTKGELTELARKRLSYVLDFLNHHPVVEASNIHFVLNQDIDNIISYSIDNTSKNPKFIHAANEVFADNNNLVEEDYFELIFFHISRMEERFIDFNLFLSDRGRYENELYLVKTGQEKYPVVDNLILEWVEALTGTKAEVKAPVILTHDVDFVQKISSPWSIIKKTLGHLKNRKTLNNLDLLWKQISAHRQGEKDPFDTFEWLLSMKDVEKTIYFLRGGKHKEDNWYPSSHSTYLSAIANARKRNYNIGIHPSYLTYNDAEKMALEKIRLEEEVGENIWRSRQHFLNFKIDETLTILENLGIKEDSSLGYARRVGFRCGTGFPYKLYDFQHERTSSVTEYPLVFMDTAWRHEAIRSGNWRFPDLAGYYGAFNFHNSFFDDMEMRDKEMKTHYLKYFSE